MATAAELRAEVQKLKGLVKGVTDPVVLAEMQTLIDELEHLARQSDNGDAREVRGDIARERGWLPGQRSLQP